MRSWRWWPRWSNYEVDFTATPLCVHRRFISSHGYGLRDPLKPEGVDNGWFFPGSGPSIGWPGEADTLNALKRPSTLAASTAHSFAAEPATDSAPAGPAAVGEGVGGTATSSPPTSHQSNGDEPVSSSAASASTAGLLLDPQGLPSSISGMREGAMPPPEPVFEASVRHPSIINVSSVSYCAGRW